MFRMTSDEFFEQNQMCYDIIFIDGLHEHEQVWRDMNHAWHALNHDGVIVCHDMSPQLQQHQTRARENPTGLWNGDCWHAWMQARHERENWSMCVVDVDFGVGVIEAGEQQLLNVPESEWTWSGLQRNRVEWLNLIDMDQWKMRMIRG